METATEGPLRLRIAGAEVTIAADVLAGLWLADLMRKGTSAPAAPASSALTPPAIGKPWQGGLYAGVSLMDDGRPCHLILANTERTLLLNWAGAQAWADELTVEDHNDWTLPNRHDGLVLFKNLKGEFSENWHWTSEQHAQDSGYAWVQTFYYGYQLSSRKGDEYRARAVRRLVIQ